MSSLPGSHQAAFARQKPAQGFQHLIMLLLQHSRTCKCQQSAAVRIGQHLAELFDPTQELRPGVGGGGVTRQHQLGNIANTAHRRIRFLRVQGVPQPENMVGWNNPCKDNPSYIAFATNTIPSRYSRCQR